VVSTLLSSVAQKLCRCEHGVFKRRTCAQLQTLPCSEILCCCSWTLALSTLTRNYQNKTIHWAVIKCVYHTQQSQSQTDVTDDTLCNSEETAAPSMWKYLRLSLQTELYLKCVHQMVKQLKSRVYWFPAGHQLQQLQWFNTASFLYQFMCKEFMS
jgi:hypothetical protein